MEDGSRGHLYDARGFLILAFWILRSDSLETRKWQVVSQSNLRQLFDQSGD